VAVEGAVSHHPVRPLWWAFAAVSSLWAVVAVVASSDGAISVFEFLSYVFGGLILTAATLIAGAVLVIRAVRRGARLGQSIPLPLRLQVAFLLIGLLGVQLDLPFDARFAASRSALERAAEDVRSGRRPAQPGWIGLFHMAEVDTAGPSVRFITGECFVDHCGIAFSREGEPPRVGEDSYVHMDGPWWRWHRSW
jgi:hypothetical protein